MTTRRIAHLVPTMALAAVLLLAAPAYASPTGPGPRVPGPRHSTSTNWSGYAVETNLSSPQSNAVGDVRAKWTVTTVTATPMNAYSSTWIGIDGYSSGSVEQIGTEADWYNGVPVYYAWYEMYPKGSVMIRSFAVRPGDVISADVAYTSSRRFTLTLKNVTTGATFSTVQKANAKRSSAEWIVEAPWSGSTLPLADFGTIPFSSGQATINGHVGTIGDVAWQRDPLTMVGSTSGRTEAVPSTLSPAGDAFGDTWFSAN